MGWGKYTNEELGINRNITCSMFTGKGVSIEPAKDVECAAVPGTKVLTEALLAQHLHDSYDNEPGNGKSLKSFIDDSIKHILDIARENDIKRDPALMRKWIKEEIIGAYKELTHLSIKDSPENRKQMKRILQQFDSYITKSVLQARLKHKDLFMSNEIDENDDIQCANKKIDEKQVYAAAVRRLTSQLSSDPKAFAEDSYRYIMNYADGDYEYWAHNIKYWTEKSRKGEWFYTILRDLSRAAQDVAKEAHCTPEEAMQVLIRAQNDIIQACKPYEQRALKNLRANADKEREMHDASFNLLDKISEIDKRRERILDETDQNNKPAKKKEMQALLKDLEKVEKERLRLLKSATKTDMKYVKELIERAQWRANETRRFMENFIRAIR